MSTWLEDLMNGNATVDETEIPKDLGEVTRLATALVEAQGEVSAAEKELKDRKERLNRIQQDLLPAALTDLGLAELKLESGRKISLKQFVNCSYNKEDPQAVFDWLRESGHDEIIKSVVSIAFGKGQDELATDYLEFVRGWNRLGEVDLEDKKTIHPQTLNKFAKDQLAEGEPLPEDLFSVFTGTKAEIK